MLIQLDHVKKEYGDFTLELDMQIPENRVTGLIGANGAGKSSLIDHVQIVTKMFKISGNM